jgi:hypothetical protein
VLAPVNASPLSDLGEFFETLELLVFRSRFSQRFSGVKCGSFSNPRARKHIDITGINCFEEMLRNKREVGDSAVNRIVLLKFFDKVSVTGLSIDPVLNEGRKDCEDPHTRDWSVGAFRFDENEVLNRIFEDFMSVSNPNRNHAVVDALESRISEVVLRRPGINNDVLIVGSKRAVQWVKAFVFSIVLVPEIAFPTAKIRHPRD